MTTPPTPPAPPQHPPVLPVVQSLTAALRAATICLCGRNSTVRLFCPVCAITVCPHCRCCPAAYPHAEASDLAAATSNLAGAAAALTPSTISVRLRLRPPPHLTLRLRPPPIRPPGVLKRRRRDNCPHPITPPPPLSSAHPPTPSPPPPPSPPLHPSPRPSPHPTSVPPPFPILQSPHSNPVTLRSSSPASSPSPSVRKSQRRRRPSSRLRAAEQQPSTASALVSPSSAPRPSPPSRPPTASTSAAVTARSATDAVVTPRSSAPSFGNKPDVHSPSSPLEDSTPMPTTHAPPHTTAPSVMHTALPAFNTASSPAVLSPTARGALPRLTASPPVHASSCPPTGAAVAAGGTLQADSSPLAPVLEADALVDAAPRPMPRAPPQASPPPSKRRRVSPDMRLSGSRRRRVRAVMKRPRGAVASLDSSKSAALTGTHSPSPDNSPAPSPSPTPSCAALQSVSSGRRDSGPEVENRPESGSCSVVERRDSGEGSVPDVVKRVELNGSLDKGMESSLSALKQNAGSVLASESVRDSEGRGESALTVRRIESTPSSAVKSGYGFGIESGSLDLVAPGSSLELTNEACASSVLKGSLTSGDRKSVFGRSASGSASLMRTMGTPLNRSEPMSIGTGESGAGALSSARRNGSLDESQYTGRRPSSGSNHSCVRQLSLGTPHSRRGSGSGPFIIDPAAMPVLPALTDKVGKSAQEHPVPSFDTGVEKNCPNQASSVKESFKENPETASSDQGIGVIIPETPTTTPAKPRVARESNVTPANGRRVSDETTKSPEKMEESEAAVQSLDAHCHNDSVVKEVAGSLQCDDAGALPETEASGVIAGKPVKGKRSMEGKKRSSGPRPIELPETQNGDNHEKCSPGDESFGVSNVLRDISNCNSVSDEEEGTPSKGNHKEESRKGNEKHVQTPKQSHGTDNPPVVKAGPVRMARLPPPTKDIVGSMVVCMSPADDEYEELDLAFELLTRLGGEVVPDFSAERPHCVISRVDKHGEIIGKPPMAVYMGVAGRVSVVGVSWLVESYNRGMWMPLDVHRAHFPRPPTGVFDKVTATLDSAFTRSAARADAKREGADLRTILTLAGADVLEGARARDAERDADNLLQLGKMRIHVVRDGGEAARRARPRRGLGVVVEAAWVLRSVLSGVADWSSLSTSAAA